MRCILVFDEDKELLTQKVAAYSAMQPLSEPPAYKEEDIKNTTNKEFFLGYKFAIDEMSTALDNLIYDGRLREKKKTLIMDWMYSTVVEVLWSILDGEYVDEDNEEC